MEIYLFTADEVLAAGSFRRDGEGDLIDSYGALLNTCHYIKCLCHLLSDGNTSSPFSNTGGSSQILNQVAPVPASGLLAAGDAELR